MREQEKRLAELERQFAQQHRRVQRTTVRAMSEEERKQADVEYEEFLKRRPPEGFLADVNPEQLLDRYLQFLAEGRPT